MNLIRALPIVALLAFLPASVSFGQTADPGLALGQPAVKEQVRAAIQEMLGRPAFHSVTGVPDDALGFDGDTALDVAIGTIYRKQGGAWLRIGELWLDPSTEFRIEPSITEPATLPAVPALPPAPPVTE